MIDFFSRLDIYMKFKGLNDNRITVEAGVSNGLLGKARKKGGALSLENISKILCTYDDLSAKWLLTGRGDMLESTAEQQMQVTNRQPAAPKVPQQSIPVYDLQMGGRMGSLFDEAMTPTDYISLPNLPKCDGAVFMYGDTMSPELQAGDIVVFKRVKDLRNGVFFGQMHLVAFEIDGEEYLTIKYVQASDNKGSVTLVGENGKYAPKDIPFDSIKAMAIVKASVRYNTVI